MKQSIPFVLFLIFLSNISVWAHPGVGIVCDRYGNIYYTDLQQVWKIDRKGQKKIVIPNVHTHELLIDLQNNVYGEDLLYSGEATNQFHHYVWRLSAEGKFDTIIPITNGPYIENYSFVQDENNNSYWIQHSKEDIIYKRSPDGQNKEWYRGKLKNVQWMHFLNGKLFFLQDDDIYALNEKNGLQLFAKDLNKNQGPYTFFGLWSDSAGNLYVANYHAKKVQQINKNGQFTDYWLSENEWAPTGGTFNNLGQLWLLLTNPQNEVKTLQVALPDSPIKLSTNHSFLPYGPMVLLVIGIALLLFIILKNTSKNQAG